MLERPAVLGHRLVVQAGGAVSLVCASWLGMSPWWDAATDRCLAQGIALTADLAADERGSQRPFQLPQQSSEAIEALNDFQRFVRQGAWDRALAALQTVQSQDASKLLATPTGLLLPTQEFVQQRLATLPAAGKQAYRVFYEAEAKALYATAAGDEELKKLQELVTSYLITSVGDLAADRLGDLLFESGEFEQAAATWQLILDNCPQSSLPRATTLAKRAIALARSGRWEKFGKIRLELKERHAGESVTLGGRTVIVARFLQQWASTASPNQQSASPTELPGDPRLPEEVQGETIAPRWQFFLYGKAAGPQPLQMHDRWGRQSPSRLVLPTDVDQQRLYGNLMGYLFALDLATGKLLWRTGDFDHLPGELRNNHHLFPDRYRVTVAAGRVWAVADDPQRRENSGNANFALLAYNAADGTALLNSRRIASLKEWSFLGTPLCAGRRIFAGASRLSAPNELYLLSLELRGNNLEQQWAIPLGTYHSSRNVRGIGRSPLPELVRQGNRILVDTQAGAVVQLHAETGQLAWGLYYEASAAHSNNRFSWHQPLPLLTVSRPFVYGGTLFVKGLHSRQVQAVQLEPPSLAWQRPVDQASIVIGCDAERLYVGGPELAAYDLADRSRRLLWSKKMPMDTDYLRPLMTRTRLYQYTHRGIYEVDKTSGEILRIFRGADRNSVGGVLHLTDDALLTISDRAVTAYATAAGQAPDHDLPAAAPSAPPQSGGVLFAFPTLAANAEQ